MERLLRIASPLGLYAEEFEVDRARHLGQLPAGVLPPGPDRGRRRGSSWPTGSRSCRCERNDRRVGTTRCLTTSWSSAAAWPASPARRQLGDEGIRVTLVDRNDYHQFQPLLYQVATSQLPAEDIARPAPDDLQGPPVGRGRDRARWRTSTWPTRSLTLADGRTLHRLAPGDGRGRPAELLRRPGRRRARVPAVLGGRRRAAAAAPPGPAAGALDGTAPPEAGQLDVVVVGGGPTGVETTGALAELMQALHATGRLATPGRITLVDRGDALLGAVLRARPTTTRTSRLTTAGAELRLGVGVTAVHADRVEFDDGSVDRDPHRGVGRRRVGRGGRAGRRARRRPRRPDRRRAGPDRRRAIPGVYAVGDVANIPSGDDDGTALPQLGSVAQQSGRWAATQHPARAGAASPPSPSPTRTRASWR